MADRTAVFNPLDDEKQWQVTAYLTALSPQLQKSARQLNQQQQRRDASMKAAEAVAAQEGPVGDYDEAAATSPVPGQVFPVPRRVARDGFASGQ